MSVERAIVWGCITLMCIMLWTGFVWLVLVVVS